MKQNHFFHSDDYEYGGGLCYDQDGDKNNDHIDGVSEHRDREKGTSMNKMEGNPYFGRGFGKEGRLINAINALAFEQRTANLIAATQVNPRDNPAVISKVKHIQHERMSSGSDSDPEDGPSIPTVRV